MSALKLHDIIISELDKISSNPEYRQKLLQQKGEDQNGHLRQQQDLLKKAKQEIEIKQHRILVAYESGNLPLEEFGKARRRLDNEDIRMIDEITKIEDVLFDRVRAKETRERFLDLLNNFKKNFHKIEFAQQKTLLQSLIVSVVVKSDEVKINYRI